MIITITIAFQLNLEKFLMVIRNSDNTTKIIEKSKNSKNISENVYLAFK